MFPEKFLIKRERSARSLWKNSDEHDELGPLMGRIIKTKASGSYYLVVGATQTGRIIYQGLNACPLEAKPGVPKEVLIPWATLVEDISLGEESSVMARVGKKVQRLRQEYRLPHNNKA